jgi:hypothetical protein
MITTRHRLTIMHTQLNFSISQQLYGAGADMDIANGSGLVWIALIGLLVVLGLVLCCNELYLRHYRERSEFEDETDRQRGRNA